MVDQEQDKTTNDILAYLEQLEAKNKQLRDALILISEDEDGYCRWCGRGAWKGCLPDCDVALALKQ